MLFIEIQMGYQYC